MIASWLERNLGSIVAPDEKFEAEHPPAEEGVASSFWNMVAPDPAYEEKQKTKAPPSPTTSTGSPVPTIGTAPPPTAFMSPGFKMDHIQCMHCKKTTPVRSATKPSRDLEGFSTPSPKNTAQQSSVNELSDELNKLVISAAKGYSESIFSPKEVQDANNKVFRLCASGKPLASKLTRRLENLLVKDKNLLKARSTQLGTLCPEGMTPLMAAASVGNLGAAKIILTVDQDGGHLDRDFQGRTALHIAAQEGNYDIIEALQEKHKGDAIPPEALVDLTGRTPFGTLLTSPNPKARKNRPQIEKIMFPKTSHDISIFGSPPPVAVRQTVYHSLDMVAGESEMPGYRVKMEDAICSASWHDAESGESYCLQGVCDGHSDSGLVSQYVAKEIAILIQAKTREINKQEGVPDWQKIWTDACLEIDRKLKVEGLAGGSTAVLALITKSEIIVANVGDSRCFLVQQATVEASSSQPAEPGLVEEKEAEQQEAKQKEESTEEPTPSSEEPATATQEAGAETEEPQQEAKRGGYVSVALSEDHKPDLSHERERVEKAGMTVFEEKFMENGQEVTIHKVQKNSSSLMAVSRSFGDFEYKANNELGPEEQAIIAVPEVRVHSRDAEKDMYLVSACDGVWDVMTNDDVAKFIVEKAESMKEAANERGRLPEIGDELLKECLERGSRDNLTVVVGALSKSMEKFAVGSIKGKALTFASPEEDGEK